MGKPPTAHLGQGRDGRQRLRFDRHAAVGADIAHDILTRLRLSAREIDAVCHMVANHMHFMHVRQMRRATLRTLMGHVQFQRELELHRLDCSASHGSLENYTFLREEQERMANEPVLPKPWINGRDVMALGLAEGPRIGRLLKACYEQQLENRFENRQTLLAWLKEQVEVEKDDEKKDAADA